MIQTFWFVRLVEGEVWKNLAWKWQQCCGKVEEGDGNRKKDRESLSQAKNDGTEN